MKKSDYSILFLVALGFFGLLACLQKVPGYMDAEYYFGQALRVFQHHDLIEPFIWNYLNNPTGINMPGFSFWQPMTSFLAAGGLWISGTNSFFAAKVLFIFMAAAVTLMTAFFANQFLPERRAGWLAGLLTLFSGFYLPFVMITDTFTPYMFFGGLFFLCIWFAEKRYGERKNISFLFIAIGSIAGLMSLTRSDGVLWLIGGWMGVFLINGVQRNKIWKVTPQLGMVLVGFIVVMTPWYLRNLSIYHSLYPSGNGLMFWLTKYDDLFVYPITQLNISSWIDTGVITILGDRLGALCSNVQTLIASGGTVVLAPMMMIGLWKNRKSIIIQLTLAMMVGLLAIMTLIFPYAGERGGFFHSLSAVQVILWSLVPVGLDAIIQWGVKQRKWKTDRSWRMFGIALVIVVGIISALIVGQKLTNGAESGIPWNESQTMFAVIDQAIIDQTGSKNDLVMVNNPPGYTLATGRPSIMIPSGGEEALIDVSHRYNIGYMVVNGERTEVLGLLKRSEKLGNHFQFLFNEAGNSVYQFKP